MKDFDRTFKLSTLTEAKEMVQQRYSDIESEYRDWEQILKRLCGMASDTTGKVVCLKSGGTVADGVVRSELYNEPMYLMPIDY